MTYLADSFSEQSPLLDRRGGCGEAADGVVVQDPARDKQSDEAYWDFVEQPPRRFAPPLLSRRGDRSLKLSVKLCWRPFRRGRFSSQSVLRPTTFSNIRFTPLVCR